MKDWIIEAKACLKVLSAFLNRVENDLSPELCAKELLNEIENYADLRDYDSANNMISMLIEVSPSCE